MSEWGIALIAAGAAILGSTVTGFFAWRAGHRQAAGAEAAGQSQAQALISTVQATLDEQRRARADDRRRQAYAALLTAAFDYQISAAGADGARMLAAVSAVEIEGPPEVADRAIRYSTAVTGHVERRSEGVDASMDARHAYVTAVRRALNEELA
ncbi:hypothetical protein [Streptomyces sp. NPDC059071]|uniref:hypothetical protein n=1 Tax=unclassified Streptomyces TaxID=2593676 RepID=UPI00364D547D